MKTQHHLNMVKNFAREHWGHALMGLSILLFLALMYTIAYNVHKSMVRDGASEAICQMVKPEMLNPDVCNKD